jgi:CheY-like chemotaxis protein
MFSNQIEFSCEGKLHFGSVPEPADTDPVVDILRRRSHTDVFANHFLSDELDAARHFRNVALGVLAIPISRIPNDHVILFRCEIAKTVRWAGKRSQAAIRIKAATGLQSRATFQPEKPGGRFLIVEDEYIIAQTIRKILLSRGAEAVAIVSSSRQALEQISETAIDFAILDVKLGGETSEIVAHALAAKGVMFIFATGYSDAANLPDAFATVPRLAKPFRTEQLLELIPAEFLNPPS